MVIINGGHGLMGGNPLGAIQTDVFYKDFN